MQSTGKRVAVVQIEPFKQPVVYERCYERKCRILRGNCVQVNNIDLSLKIELTLFPPLTPPHSLLS